MPIATNRINVPVDEIEIIDGPGRATMQVNEAFTDPYVVLYDSPLENGLRVAFTVRTLASEKSFRLRVELFRVRGRWSALTANHDSPTDEVLFQGQAGEWLFTGIYDVHDRTGQLHYCDQDEMMSLPS